MIIFLRVLVALSYSVIVGVCASISFLYFAPMDAWTVYHKVEPVKAEFVVNEAMQFTSTRTVKRKSTLDFNDILFCKAYPGADDFNPVSYYKSGRTIPPSDGVQKVTWPYIRPVNRATDCYLESTITLRLPFGISKQQRVVGPIFKIVEPEPEEGAS